MKNHTSLLQEFAADNKIEITGIENIPELAIAPIITGNPFNEEDEDFYCADQKFITMAKMGDKITHHKQVSDQFKVSQYTDTLHATLESILNETPEFGIPKVSLKFGGGGGSMFAKYVFPSVEMNIANNKKKADKVIPATIIKDSIDSSGKFDQTTGVFRLICSNGMIIAHPDYTPEQFKMMHKQGTYQLGDALHSMNLALKQVSQSTDLWKTYMKEKIDTLMLSDIMDVASMSISQQIKAVQIPLAGEKAGSLMDNIVKGRVSAWTAYNALTQFATHEVKNPKVEHSMGHALTKAFDQALGMY